MTQLKWFRLAQPLPEDTLGRSADRSSKGMDGSEPMKGMFGCPT